MVPRFSPQDIIPGFLDLLLFKFQSHVYHFIVLRGLIFRLIEQIALHWPEAPCVKLLVLW